MHPLFITVCIPLRLYLASLEDRWWLRGFAAVVSYRWLTGLNDSRVGFFGGPAWWAWKRPMHGVLWGLYAATGDSLPLYADVLLAPI